MISVIAFLLVSGCVCAPSGNTTSSSSSSSSSGSSSSVSSSSKGPDGVVYSITQKFSSSSGVPNITTSLDNVKTTLPFFGSSIFNADKTAEAIRNQTNQAFAAIQKQNQAHFTAMNNMSGSIQKAVKESHAAFQNSMKTMFRPLSLFSSSPFFF